MEEIDSARLIGTDADELLDEIRSKRNKGHLTLIVVIVAFCVGLIALSISGTEHKSSLPGILLAVCVLMIATIPWTRWLDRRSRIVRIRYVLDPLGLQVQEAIRRFSCALEATSRIWSVREEDVHGDWKRNAGAGTSVKRMPVQVRFEAPPGIATNVRVGCMVINQRRLYFFPDRILIYSPRGIGSLNYDELDFHGGTVRFVESEAIPRDAIEVDRTWLYVNKNGSPDRRFSNNMILPVLLYGVLEIRSSLFRLQLQTSIDRMGTEAASLFRLVQQAIASVGRSRGRKSIASDMAQDDFYFEEEPPPLAGLGRFLILKWVPDLPEWAQPIVWGVVAALPVVLIFLIVRFFVLE